MSKHDHNITVEDVERNNGTVTTDRWHSHDQLVAALRTLIHMLLTGQDGSGEDSTSGSAKSKKNAVCWKCFEKAKVLIMERLSVELAISFVVRSSLTIGPLLRCP